MNQLALPVAGDLVAIMHTNMGDISIRLFPDHAPKAVENFTTHAKNGYYDGIVFHRVIKDFMIQGGDPTATGCGGESIWVTTLRMSSPPSSTISAVPCLWLTRAPAPTAVSSSSFRRTACIPLCWSR